MKSVVITAALLTPNLALAQAMPIRIEQGQNCPTGYYHSGNFCAPFKDATPTIPKRQGETCPTGTYASGGACVAFR